MMMMRAHSLFKNYVTPANYLCSNYKIQSKIEIKPTFAVHCCSDKQRWKWASHTHEYLPIRYKSTSLFMHGTKLMHQWGHMQCSLRSSGNDCFMAKRGIWVSSVLRVFWAPDIPEVISFPRTTKQGPKHNFNEFRGSAETHHMWGHWGWGSQKVWAASWYSDALSIGSPQTDLTRRRDPSPRQLSGSCCRAARRRRCGRLCIMAQTAGRPDPERRGQAGQKGSGGNGLPNCLPGSSFTTGIFFFE